MKKIAAVLISVIIFGAAVWAQSADEFIQKASQAQSQKQFAQAAALYEKAFAAGSTDGDAAYDAACCYALIGGRDKAFEFLKKAGEFGWSNADHARKDTDLVSLRTDPRWAPALALFDKNAKYAQVMWTSPAWNTPYAEDLPADVKVAGLSRFWSEVKYNFAFPQKLAALDWDALYISFIPRVRATRSTVEYYEVLQELCAKLQDGHTNILMPNEYWKSRVGRLGLQTRLIEGRVLVNKLWDLELEKQGLAKGMEIVKINGLPTRQYAEKNVIPRLSSSTTQYLDILACERSLFLGPVSEPVQLTLEAGDGRTLERTARRLSLPDLTKLAPNPNPEPFAFRMLPGNIAHVVLNSFMDDKTADEFFKHFAEIAAADVLILDLRENGGGNSNVGYRVLAGLAKEPFLDSRWSTRDYKPAYRSWGRPDRLYTEAAGRNAIDQTHHFAGPVIVLTSPRTFSAAEDFLVAFDQSGRGTIMGEPSGGSTGNPLYFKLPGGGGGLVCSKHDAYADGKEFVGVGVQPQVAAHPTVADFRAGKDTVLDKAVALIEKGRPKKAGEVKGPYFGQRLPGETPELFASEFLSARYGFVARIAFSPDGAECFFTVPDATFSHPKIYGTRKVGDTWTEPAIPSFADPQWINHEPFFSQDGNKIFFTSNRQTQSAANKRDFWVSERTSTGWSDPRRLPPPINSDQTEYFYSQTADGTAYFCSDRPNGIGALDIYRVRSGADPAAPAENLGAPVNSKYYNGDPCISPDGRFLVFGAVRPEGRGGMDLYVTFADGSNGWTVPANLGEGFNTPANEYAPSLSPDGRFLFFTRHDGRRAVLHWVRASVLERFRPNVSPTIKKRPS